MNPEEELGFVPDDDLGFVADEPEPSFAAPKPSTAAGNAAWADALSPAERAAILARAALPPASEQDRARAQYLLGRHVDRSMGIEDTAQPIVGRDERPTAGVTGLVQGATLGWADEARGAVRSAMGEGSYQAERDRARAQVSRAREQAPAAYALGEVAGTAPLAAIPGAGGGAGSRIATQAAIGAGLGTASGAGFSEGETTDEVIRDAVVGGAMGGTLGAAGQTVSEGARAGLGALGRAASQADRLRVASIATGTSRELQDTLIREAQGMPGGVAGVAERIRRMGIVPPVGTAQDVADGAAVALDRVGEGGELGRIYQQLDEIAPVERQRLLAALDRYAASVESDPVMRRFGSAVRRRAEDFAETLPDTISYQRAREILRGLGDQVNWIDPATGARPPQQVAQGTYRALRTELDDIGQEALERTVGSEAADAAMEAFRRARLDTNAAMFAEEWASRALDRLARNRGISASDYAAGLAGSVSGGAVQGVLSGAANRALRLREGTIRATGAEIAQRLLARSPERLGRWAGPLQRALSQGGAAFAAAHMALSTRDPEYRRAIEQASEEAAEDPQE